MKRFWEPVILPILRKLKPGHVVEIGSDLGINTKLLLDYCQESGSRLSVIEPLPQYDVELLKNSYPDVLEFHQKLSIEALAEIKDCDLVLIDGDHNWYTVYHELKQIEAGTAGGAFPVIIFHDVGWPYGRRDMYYDPETVPKEFRKPYKQAGILPGQRELADEGGLNTGLNNALFEDDPRSGVRTAIDDFMQESGRKLDFLATKAFYGLGVLFAPDRALRSFVEKLLHSPELIDVLEQKRVELCILRSDLHKKTGDLRAERDAAREGLWKQTGRLDQLAAEKKAVEERLRGHEKELGEARRQVEEGLERQKELKRLLDGQKGEIESLKSELATKLRQAEEKFKEVSSSLEAEIASLSAKIKAKDTESLKARKRLDELDRQNAELAAMGQSLFRAFDGYRRKAASQIEFLVHTIEKLEGFIQKLEQSRRWKVGDAIGTALRKATLRPPVKAPPFYLRKVAENFKKRSAEIKNFAATNPLQGIQVPSRPAQVSPRATVPSGTPIPGDLMKVSVVSAIYNKSASLADYVGAFAGQTYAGPIELVLVDDCSTDDSVEVIGCLREAYRKITNLQIRLVRNQTNLGNCGSRNRGIARATGDILVVIDGDVLVNRKFIEEHVTAHRSKGYDICIGPMGMQSRGRDIYALLAGYEQDSELLKKEMLLQYSEAPGSPNHAFFLNCVTRNFSITREFLESLDEPLFDETFAYSTSPDSGFGWEDVEMGYRLYSRGAGIWFCPDAISVHKTHEPEIPDREKPERSVKNFRRLLTKHPEIVKLCPNWVEDTFSKIERWLEKHGYAENQDRSFLKPRIASATASIPPRPLASKPGDRLKILTYRWHVGHQYDLWKLPHDFTLSFGKSGIAASWDYGKRPLPGNATFRRMKDPGDLKGFDLAILHFDDFVLHPELAQGAVSSCWGNQFKFILENFEGPKVAICHGVPPFKGACDPGYDKPDRGEIIESYRREMVEYLGDTLVICNSHQAQKEWGFKHSKVIWQAFDPLMYPPASGEKGIISVVGGIKTRPLYRGYDLYLDVMERIGWRADFLGDDLKNVVEKPALVRSDYSSDNEWGLANYHNYVSFLRRYGIFFDPTLRSPMPRTRGEGMLCGLAMVLTDSHDASMFIENGRNGFVSSRPEELAAILDALLRNADLRKSIGRRGRETAMELFHINRFQSNWRETLEYVMDTSARRPAKELEFSIPPARRPSEAQRPIKGILFVAGVVGETKRYRVQNAVEAFRGVDVQVDQIAIADLKGQDLAFLSSGLYDVVVCHRVSDSETLRRLLAEAERAGILAVFDIDDLIFVPEFAQIRIAHRALTLEEAKAEIQGLRAAIRQFSYATCTTPQLKRELEAMGVPHVGIVPNTWSQRVKTMSVAALASNSQKKNPDKVVIGYPSGSNTHQRDLAVALPALIRILKEFPNVDLHLCGFIDLPEELAPFRDRVVMRPFVHHLLLPEFLAAFDINIAPLESTPFCEAKSEIKFLEAALVKVPTVASSTEPFRGVIHNGNTGYLAGSENEWYEHLKKLVVEPELRRKMGQSALDDVTEHWSPDLRVNRSLAAFEEWRQALVPAPSAKKTEMNTTKDKKKASRKLQLTEDWRSFVKDNLEGFGIEIGAMHRPFETNSRTVIKYVDSISSAELREQYRNDPNVPVEKIVEVDYQCDGQNLSLLADQSVDFVCSSHLLEHLSSPGRAIQEWLRVTKPGGTIFFVLPDKRYCFDKDREVTPLEHLINDFEQKTDRIEYAHYEDYLKNVKGITDASKVRSAHDRQGSVHVHVWTYESVLSFLSWLQERLNSFRVVDSKQIDGLHIAVVLEKLQPSKGT